MAEKSELEIVIEGDLERELRAIREEFVPLKFMKGVSRVTIRGPLELARYDDGSFYIGPQIIGMYSREDAEQRYQHIAQRLAEGKYVLNIDEEFSPSLRLQNEPDTAGREEEIDVDMEEFLKGRPPQFKGRPPQLVQKETVHLKHKGKVSYKQKVKLTTYDDDSVAIGCHFLEKYRGENAALQYQSIVGALARGEWILLVDNELVGHLTLKE